MEDVLVDLKYVEGIPETFSGVCNIEIMNIYIYIKLFVVWF